MPDPIPTTTEEASPASSTLDASSPQEVFTPSNHRHSLWVYEKCEKIHINNFLTNTSMSRQQRVRRLMKKFKQRYRRSYNRFTPASIDLYLHESFTVIMDDFERRQELCEAGMFHQMGDDCDEPECGVHVRDEDPEWGMDYADEMMNMF